MDLIRADPRRRAATLVVVLLVLVAGVALTVLLQRWLAAVAQLPAAAARPQLLAAFAWAAGSACAAILWLAASLWRSGLRVRRAAQWPLPGARVLRDTVVLRGNSTLSPVGSSSFGSLASRIGSAGPGDFGSLEVAWPSRVTQIQPSSPMNFRPLGCLSDTETWIPPG